MFYAPSLPEAHFYIEGLVLEVNLKSEKILTPRKLLRRKGMKITAMRLRVLELFFEKQEPLSHAAIFKHFTGLGQKPDKVTLYRVLSAFSEAQIVHEVQEINGPIRFCLHDPFIDECAGNHPHFLCRECERMLCLHGQTLPRVNVPEGTFVEGKQLLIFGLCPQCVSEADQGELN